MKRGIRTKLGTLGAVLGAGLAIVGLGTTSFVPTIAEASPPDSGVVSSFVSKAQQGIVQPPDLDELEQMCLLLTSCENLPLPRQALPPDFHSCVKKLGEEMAHPSAINFSLTMRECGLGANSCDDLKACALRGASPNACRGRGPDSVVGSCDPDGRALSCWHDRVLAVRDCPRGGEMCVVRDGQSSCVLGPCPANIKPGDPPACGGDGTHILRCEKGKLTSLDCAAFGLKCEKLPDGSAGCVTALPQCQGGTRRCEGNVAVGCHNGHEVRVDCGSAGMQCAQTPGATPVGLCYSAPPAQGACNPNDPPQCDGAYIKYCSGGKQRRFFCKPRFNTCVKDNTGVHCR